MNEKEINENCISKVTENSGALYVLIDKKTCEYLNITRGDLVKFTIIDVKKKDDE